MLLATANLFKVYIVVTSILSPSGSHVTSTSTGSPLSMFFIGHFAKNYGTYYVEVVSFHRLFQKCSGQVKQKDQCSDEEVSGEQINEIRKGFKVSESKKPAITQL